MSSAGSISAIDRAATLDELETRCFDCVVIGGGITGAGLARELGQRGLLVALLEAEDFASGTSSRSSKLIHGGLRYLALGDVGLVRETALERKAIHRLAPHLAERRWMIVPTRSRAGLLKLRFGVSAYERLGAVEAEDQHQNWSARELERNEPLLNRSQFPYACTYREYLTDDARLVLANLRAAVADGALAMNHLRVDAILRESGRASGVTAVCVLSGRQIRVRARTVVNAAGPWVEALRRLEDPEAHSLLVLSKGIHVVLPHARIPLHNMVVLGTQDSRSIFAIPRGEIVYVGTTDTLHEAGSQVWPEITLDEIEYVLEPLPRYLDVEPVKAEEVVAAWAGLRPLISEPGKKTTEISRRDEILIGPAGVLSIAGGKLTGYRPMAHRCAEKLAELLGRSLAPAPAEGALPGGDFDGDLAALAGALVREHGLDRRHALRLARLYGSESRKVLAAGAEPLVANASVRKGEVDWAVLEEGAARLEDWVYRRTRVALYEPGDRERILEPGAEQMARLLGWSAERTREEIIHVRALLGAELAFTRPLE
ncbi:MAG: FAD-dependent oxidoreductase [Myxococcota bacterium]